MSALRQMLASLWAALWLGWRMAGVRTRRVLGRGGPVSAATAGPSFYLRAAEIPAEGVDYDVRELPADIDAHLLGVRAELVGTARGKAARQTRRRKARRRRTAALAMAALLTLAVLGAGATALVTGSTGVPAVDRLLGIYEKGLGEPGAPGPSDPGGGDLQPGSGQSVPIEVPVPGEPSVTIVTAFYVARDGRACWAMTVDSDGRARPTRGSIGCEASSILTAELERDGLYVTGLSIERGTIALVGYLGDDVSGLTGRGPTGALDIHLGKPWQPDRRAGSPVRPFVATAAIGDSQSLQGSRLLDPRKYSFELDVDGRSLEVEP